MPNSVNKIYDHAFSGCTGLKSAELSSGLTEIGEYAFESCKMLKSIKIPSSVTKIGKGAFFNCINLANVEMPNSKLSVSRYSFDGTRIFETNWNNWNKELIASRKKANLCQHCGGRFTGVLRKVCCECRRSKDY